MQPDVAEYEWSATDRGDSILESGARLLTRGRAKYAVHGYKRELEREVYVEKNRLHRAAAAAVAVCEGN